MSAPHVTCLCRTELPVRKPPNKRLKLPAPGRGKNCVCAPASSVVISTDVTPAVVGAAA